MLSVTFRRKVWQFPVRWSELTPEHSRLFIRMASEMADFEAGRTDFDTFTVGMTLAILGIRKVKGGFTGTFAENIYRLGEQLDFPYRIVTAPDGTKEAILTVNLSENLIPRLRHRRGYSFRYDLSGKMDCSLTAEQYIDVLALMQAWQKTRRRSALESIAATLYPGVNPRRLSDAELYGVYYNFRGILSWIRAIPAYGLIFRTASETEGAPAPRKAPAGLSSSIYSLAKAGYGSIDDIAHLPLFNYLDLLLQQTVESIRSLAAASLKPTQISSKLDLPVELILEYVKE